MENPVFDFFWFKGRGEDVRKAVQQFVTGVVDLVDEGDGCGFCISCKCGGENIKVV